MNLNGGHQLGLKGASGAGGHNRASGGRQVGVRGGRA